MSELAARRWVLRLDGMPPSPNARLHYMARARSAKHWRQLAALTAQREHVPPMPRVRVSAVLTRRRLGLADEDNDRARVKPIVDGIVDAGVISRDTRGHVEWGDVTEQRGAPGVVLIVEDASDSPAAEGWR